MMIDNNNHHVIFFIRIKYIRQYSWKLKKLGASEEHTKALTAWYTKIEKENKCNQPLLDNKEIKKNILFWGLNTKKSNIGFSGCSYKKCLQNR